VPNRADSGSNSRCGPVLSGLRGTRAEPARIPNASRKVPARHAGPRMAARPRPFLITGRGAVHPIGENRHRRKAPAAGKEDHSGGVASAFRFISTPIRAPLRANGVRQVSLLLTGFWRRLVPHLEFEVRRRPGGRSVTHAWPLAGGHVARSRALYGRRWIECPTSGLLPPGPGVGLATLRTVVSDLNRSPSLRSPSPAAASGRRPRMNHPIHPKISALRRTIFGV
jgi:hypothetical protein